VIRDKAIDQIFTAIPASMSKLVNLKTVHFFYAFLEKIPDSFLVWTKLERLSISLREESDWNSLLKLKQLKNLKELRISCLLPEGSAIPPVTHQLDMLQKLSFMHSEKFDISAVQVALPHCEVDRSN